MKKPLQNQNEGYFTWRNGKLLRWSNDGLRRILKAANDAALFEVDPATGYTVFTGEAIHVAHDPKDRELCKTLEAWMSRLISNEARVNIINEINQLTGRLRYIHILDINEEGSAFWHYQIADMSRIPTPTETAALMFSEQLVMGNLENLKRCAQEECNKFFIGRANRRWCSDSCGSKSRVRTKRKRDRS